MPVHHISLVVADVAETTAFYTAALAPLGYRKLMSFADDSVVGLGSCGPDLWITSKNAPLAEGSETRHPAAGTEELRSLSSSGEPRPLTGPIHIAFTAKTRAQVRAFHEAALKAGGKCNGTPGLRPEYFATYYGAFVYDAEGRNIEAVCIAPGFWAEDWGIVGWSTVGAMAVGIAGAVAKWGGWI